MLSEAFRLNLSHYHAGGPQDMSEMRGTALVFTRVVFRKGLQLMAANYMEQNFFSTN